jgi:hypothetical protein
MASPSDSYLKMSGQRSENDLNNPEAQGCLILDKNPVLM